MKSLISLSAGELVDGYRRKIFSPVDVVEALRDHFQVIEPKINAFTTPLFNDAAQAAARCADAIAKGEDKPLLGTPVAIKDLIDTARIRTTYGSRMFADHVPQHNAQIVNKLVDAGAIILGKSATHEFAWGFTTDNPHYGPTRNPWAMDRIPGGSSGGSAAALAAHCAPLAIGTDTGGSIRLPAAYCGVCGLKPTHARLGLDGIFPLAPSLDHVGPMARTPQDLDLFMAALDDDYQPMECSTFTGMRIAVPHEAAYTKVPADIADIWRQAILTLEKLGATIRPFSDPLILDCAEIFTAIMVVEATQTHREQGLYPARRGEYGTDVQARFTLAEKISDEELAAAQRDRDLLRRSFAELFDDVDQMLTLCSSAPPLPIVTRGDNAVQHYAPLRDTILRHTAPQDLAGLPATAVRVGIDTFGLPVGCQFTAARGRDALSVAAARMFHAATLDIQHRWPKMPPVVGQMQER